MTMEEVDASTEHRHVREGVVEAFRAADAEYNEARQRERDTSQARMQAQAEFVAEIESVAMGRVHQAHPDCCHPNGDNSGALREQVARAFAVERYGLWQQLAPQCTNPPFSPPREEPTEAERERRDARDRN
jgi:hypothetical protein